MTDWKTLGYCWIGGGRYTRPLDSTADKKWQALSGLSIDMSVIGFAASLRPQRFDQHARFYLLPQYHQAVLRYATFFVVAPVLALWLVLRGKARVLITQSPYEGAVAACVKDVAHLLGRQVIVIVESHGDFEVSVFMQRKIRFVGLFRRTMTGAARYALDRADLLRAVSGVTHRQLHEWAPDKPIEQFMAWTDADVFAQTIRECPLSQTQDILYAGVLIPRKGVHVLLEAFGQVAAEVSGSHLWLVGAPENLLYTRQLEQQVEQLGLGGRVTFVGSVSQQVLARYMGRARAVVLPSLSEGLGRVVVEAMLCGTPVVGSRVGGIPDLIQEGVTGYLVPPGDAGALADALLKALTDPACEAMGQRAREFAVKFLSTETFVNGYRRLFEQAATLFR